MRDEDWRTIIILHECQNLTKAAAAMYLSQPTLTKQVRRIEAELGVEIVNRSNRGISFTEAGEFLAAQARSILKLIDDTKANLKTISITSDQEE